MVPNPLVNPISFPSFSHRFPIKSTIWGEKNYGQSHIWTGGPAGHEGFEKESVVIHSDAVMVFPP